MPEGYDPNARAGGFGAEAAQMPDLGEVDPLTALDKALLLGTVGRVSALESASSITRTPTAVSSRPTPLSQRNQPGLTGNYWDCISMTGVSLPAPGQDWSSAFSDPAATLIYYQMPSTSGELVMAGDSTDARFAQVAVISTNAITIHGKLRMETGATSPRVQIWCNGGFQEFVASSAFTITLRGDLQPNLIRFITNFSVGIAELRWILWDGFTQFWIDPNDNTSATGHNGSGGFGAISGPAGQMRNVFASISPSAGGSAAPGLPAGGGTTSVCESSPVDAVNTTIGDATHVAQIVTSPDLGIISVTSVAIQIAESQVTNLVSDLALLAPLASPTFTGTPAGPTAGAGTNTTQLATTAFVTAAIAASFPVIKDTVSLTAQAADIADTAFANSSTVGLYRVEVYLMDTLQALGAGAVTCNIKYTDASNARTQSVGPVTLTSVSTGMSQATFFVQLASGSITYGVTHTGIFSTATYALYATLERLL